MPVVVIDRHTGKPVAPTARNATPALPGPPATSITLPALTVRQPWAWGIAAGLKTVENRTWATSYRGLLAIHAAATLPRGLPADWQANDLPGGEKCGAAYVRSAVVAIAELADVVALADLPAAYVEAPHEDFDPCGPVCWVLSRVWRLATPFACGGRLSLWNVTLPVAVLPKGIPARLLAGVAGR